MANIQGFMALLPLVQKEFAITRAEAGLYTSAYFLGAIILSVLSGHMVDRLGNKTTLIIGLVIIGTMMMLQSRAMFFILLLFLAFFTGIGYSIVTPAVNTSVFEIASTSKRGIFMGIAHSGGGVGGFLGAVILPYLGNIYDWRKAILYSGIFALIVSLIIFKSYQKNSPFFKKNRKNISNTSSLKKGLIIILKNNYILYYCAYGFVLGISAFSIVGHFNIFLTQDLNYSTSFAGLSMGIVHIGGIIGLPVWGYITDKFLQSDRRKGLLIIGTMISIMALYFGLLVSQIRISVYLLFFSCLLLGFCVMGIFATYYTAIGELESVQRGVIMGISLVFTRIGAIIAPPIFGYVADLHGKYLYSWVYLGIIVLFFSMLFFYFSGKCINKKTINNQN